MLWSILFDNYCIWNLTKPLPYNRSFIPLDDVIHCKLSIAQQEISHAMSRIRISSQALYVSSDTIYIWKAYIILKQGLCRNLLYSHWNANVRWVLHRVLLPLGCAQRIPFLSFDFSRWLVSTSWSDTRILRTNMLTMYKSQILRNMLYTWEWRDLAAVWTPA